MVPRFAIYQALCERLDALDCIADASKCFHEMTKEVTQETEGEQTNWIVGE